jgi:DNA primase
MAFIFDQATISRVQQACDIVEVVGEHLNLVKKGREMVGLCPFHEDHRPSLNVNPTKQIFKCFACGAGGDVFKFLQMRENLTFSQAVERLAQRAGIEVKPAKTTRPAGTADDVSPNDLAKVNTWADKFFQKMLGDTKAQQVREYLSKRGISSDSIKLWHIGFAPAGGEELVAAARRSGVDERLLTAAGLAVGQGGTITDKFVNRLIFTITDVTGRVVGFGGRTLDGVGAKYVNSPTTALFDKSNCLYGLEQARHAIGSSGTVVVVEGYTDVIMAHQYGFKNVVATLGTSLTEGHARMLKRYAKSITLIFDSDTAGIAAANRALELCLAQQIDIKVASVPQGKDPCEFLLGAGAEAFGEVLAKAVDVFEFKWARLAGSFDSDRTIAGRKAAISEFIQSIATAMQSGNIGAIERGIIVNRLSGIIGIDAASINAQLNQRLRAARRTGAYHQNQIPTYRDKVDLGEGLFAAAQREIIEVLLNEPALFEEVQQKVQPQDFDVSALRRVAQALFDTLLENQQAPVVQVLACIEEPELGGAVVSMQQAGQEKGNHRKRLDDALAAFERHRTDEADLPVDAKQQKVDIGQLAERMRKGNPHTLGMV